MSLAERFQTWGLGQSRQSLHTEINEELEFHIQCRVDELVESEVPRSIASQQAKKEFGNKAGYAKECHRLRAINQCWANGLALLGLVVCLMVIGWLGFNLHQKSMQNQLLTQQLMNSLIAQNVVIDQEDLKGTVTDSDGNSIANAKVLLLHKTWRGSYSQSAYSTTTDDEGDYVFENQYDDNAKNAFLVTILAEGFEMRSRYEIFQGGDNVPSHDFELPTANTFRFKFLDDEGDAMANAKVFISNRLVNGEDHFAYADSRRDATWITDDEGEVALEFFQADDVIEFSVTDENDESTTRSKVTVMDDDSAQSVFVDAENNGRATPKPASPDPTPNDEEHVDWIKENAVPFTSIDPADDDFSDLESLKELIGDARVVQLGEQSHGDGTCFLTKTRLVKFLHQEMGFDVIAFESGLYDCKVAWDVIKSGEGNPVQNASLGVFGIWTGSAQTSPMWNYLDENANSENPLELAGFDCQFTGGASRKLRDDLANLTDQLKIKGLSDDEWEQFDRTLGKILAYEKPTQPKRKFLSTLSVLKHAVSQADEDVLSTDDAKFWAQQFDSMADHCGRQWQDEGNIAGLMSRDEQMARNLVWLARERYADRKIIVWAASFHIMRNPPEIQSFNGSVDYSEMIQMGHRVHEELGDEVYTIGFTAYEGRAGAYHLNKYNIGEAPEGTFESLCKAAELENGFVPFRGTKESAPWLHEFRFARPMGYSWMNARWPNHFDAMIFNRKMRPSTSN